MGVGDAGEFLDVENAQHRVGDSFAEQSLRVRTESLGDFLFACVWINEGTFDAQLLHRYGEKVESSSVDGRGGDEVVASLADVEDGVERGCLAR